MSRPRRLKGFSYIGFARYSLTFCTYERRHIFIDADVFNRTMTQIRQAAAESRFELLAYCLMPDHAHLLSEGFSEHSNLRRFVESAKLRSAYAHARAKREWLWQDGC